MLTKKFSLIAPALLACSIAGLAVAITPPAGSPGTPPPPPSGAPGSGGKEGSKEGGARKRPDFKTLDKNGDGFITADEVDPKVWERLKNLDKDGDGKVSEQEMKDGAPRGGKGGKPGGKEGGKGGDAPPAPPAPPKG